MTSVRIYCSLLLFAGGFGSNEIPTGTSKKNRRFFLQYRVELNDFDYTGAKEVRKN